MIRDFDGIIKAAQENGPKAMAVAVAEDKDVLKAVNGAYKYGIVKPILVGNQGAIEEIAKEIDMDLSNMEIVDAEDKVDASRKTVKLVKDGKAQMVMKGFVDTAIILKAVLDKEIGIKEEDVLTHVGVLKVAAYDRLFVLSDSAMNIAPDLNAKVAIVKNAVKVAHALGNDMPKVAVLAAVEKVNKKMSATVDAAELVKLNEAGEIDGCMIGGPFALDNAVSEEAAHHKGVDHPVAGKADILIVPDIEAGNMLNKSMEYFAKAEKSGVIMGAKAPIALTSRASSDASKLKSIALAVLAANA
jgi:phosphate butyryltransferase